MSPYIQYDEGDVPLFMVQPESSLTNFSKDERVRGDEGRLVANPLSELDLDKRSIILCYVCSAYAADKNFSKSIESHVILQFRETIYEPD